MKRSYDTIALVYDRLAALVYGKALIAARAYLLTEITAGAHILIAGGGTGWELDELSGIYPSGLSITYIDASGKMIALASKRNIAANKVTFIVAPVATAPIEGLYDVILTPFLFDNFTNEGLEKMISLLDKKLKPSGLWLYCDFLNTGVLWQQALLKVMYAFFRLFCGIEARELPDAAACFERHNYKISSQEFFLHKFITAIVYKKQDKS